MWSTRQIAYPLRAVPGRYFVTSARSCLGANMHKTLHKDIFWLGRQWAVTGYGIQAVNRKLEMKFDIPIIRIWDEELANSMRDESRVDSEDFNDAVKITGNRFKKTAPLSSSDSPPATSLSGER